MSRRKNIKYQQPDFITNEDLISKLGYKTPKDRGLSVMGIRKNKRETILSIASAANYSISWLQKQLDKHLGFTRKVVNG